MRCNALPPMKPAPWGLLMRNPPSWRWVGGDREIGLVEVALGATILRVRPLYFVHLPTAEAAGNMRHDRPEMLRIVA